MFQRYFSNLLDLVLYGTLKGWAFAAVPFTFPDAFFSIPVVAAVRAPFVFHVLTAPLELLGFTVLYAWLRSKHGVQGSNFAQTFSSLAVASAACAVLGLLILRTPFYYLVEPFFILAHHGAAAWAAVLLLAAKEQGLIFRNKAAGALVSILVVVLTASDFFFAFYFCFLLLFSVKRDSLKRDAAILTLVFLQAVMIFAISWKVNPSLSIQAHNSGSGGHEAFWSRFRFLMHTLLLSAPLVGLYAWSRSANVTGVRAFPYAFGAIAAASFAAVAGLISDDYTYRYATILFPVAVLLLSELILKLWRDRLPVIAFAILIFLIGALVVIGRREGVQSREAYAAEIQCLRASATPGSTIVAEYWPAKVIFESTRRRFNLRQVNGDGDPNEWIYNHRWADIFPPNGIDYLVLDGLSPNGIRNVVAGRAQSALCDGKVLRIGGLGDTQ